MPKVIFFDSALWVGSENFKFNIGLLSIASFLKSHNIETVVYYKTKDYIDNLDKIITEDVKLIGISAMTVQYKNAQNLARKIKEIRPDLKIVIGGWHVKLFPEKVLEEKAFDVAIKGDGEMPILNIYNCLISNGLLKNVKGIGFREQGRIIWTEAEKRTDLLSLPIYPVDEFFCVNKERLLRFLDLIENRNLKFTWFIQNRIDTIDGKKLTLDILKRMRKCGCTMMLLSVESGSDEMLARMNKHIKISQTIRAIKDLLATDIIPWLSLMIGMPDETKEDYLATFRLIHEAKKLSKKVSVGGPALWRPIPGSLMHQRAMTYYLGGRKREFSDQEDFISPELPDSLQMKLTDYPCIQNRKLGYEILTYVERFYNSPSIPRAIINSAKALFLYFPPSYKEKINPYFYPNYLFLFILYLFSQGRKRLLKKNINPEKFNPLLWFKWRAMIKKTNNLYFAT